MIVNQRGSFVVPLPALPEGARELTMVWIEPGTFVMGTSEAEGVEAGDGPPFKVTMSRGFWLGRYAVTQAQWQAVMEDNPSAFQDQYPDGPVENVSWYQATAFCAELNRRCQAHLPDGYTFGLPTEAQWEYACRAGTQTTYHSGDTLADLSRVAWHKENSGGHTHAVGEKEPNAWGLYDMHGNVMEWCCDSPSNYPNADAVDWVSRGDGFVRNLRSGAWVTTPTDSSFCCACRGYVEPDVGRAWFGFRLCLRPLIDALDPPNLPHGVSVALE